MTFLPIVERELRERARWRSTYWVRGIVAFLSTAIAMFVLMFVAGATPGVTGYATMQILGSLAFLFAAVEGLRNTADSLSFEKREGTIGLLFLTDLRGYDVVLGKFFASSLTSFYALIAMIPAMGVPVLIGGVTGAEFWRLVLALINMLLFSLTTGMFISSISRSERKAWLGTAALVEVFVMLIPLLSWSLKWPWLRVWSPWTTFSLYDDLNYTTAPNHYWQSLCIINVLSWFWILLASVLLPRLWQESGARRLRRRLVQEAPRARRNRNEMLALNPVWWLTSRNTHERRWLWIFVSVIAGIGVISFVAVQPSVPGLWAVFGCAIVVHLLLALWVASEASNSFAEARSTGAMELLLSTPMPVRQILRGQHLALRELFSGPIILLLAVEVLLAIAQIWLMTNRGGSLLERVAIVLVLGFCLVWFVLDLFAVAEVGMWFGLTSQKPTQALTKTVLFVLILPFALMVVPCFWFIGPGLMVAKSVIFFSWAQSKLENEFRRAATERYDLPRTVKWMRRSPPKLRMPGAMQ